jgi:hypothetical protein
MLLQSSLKRDSFIKNSLQKISLYNRTKEINEEKHKNKAFTKQKRRDIMIPTKPIA